MLIEGSSGSSRGLVGEHQPDEPMRDDVVQAYLDLLEIHGEDGAEGAGGP